MPINYFLPEYIKDVRVKQKRTPRETIVVEDRQEKNEIKKRNEEILNKPDLINEHYIDGEQRKLLDFLKEYNLSFRIYRDMKKTKVPGIKYKIVAYGTELGTGNSFCLIAQKQGRGI